MKETPILFSAPMVQAILAGRKTQTRRALKRQPVCLAGPNFDGCWSDTVPPVVRYFACPYGRSGDRLWVQETWAPNPLAPKGAEAARPYVLYRANGDTAPGWRPSIFMSRRSSRIALVEPFLVEYYGTGGAESLASPLNTVTCKERHALVRPVIIIDGERYLLDIRFRMLQPKELAAAQGFRRDYRFTGTKTEQVKQIGNAVPRNLARALVLAAVGQRSDVGELMRVAA